VVVADLTEPQTEDLLGILFGGFLLMIWHVVSALDTHLDRLPCFANRLVNCLYWTCSRQISVLIPLSASTNTNT